MWIRNHFECFEPYIYLAIFRLFLRKPIPRFSIQVRCKLGYFPKAFSYIGHIIYGWTPLKSSVITHPDIVVWAKFIQAQLSYAWSSFHVTLLLDQKGDIGRMQSYMIFNACSLHVSIRPWLGALLPYSHQLKPSWIGYLFFLWFYSVLPAQTIQN